MAKRKTNTRNGYLIAKRATDIFVAYILLACLYLPMIVIAIAVRLSTGDSAIFRQVRIGANGRKFVCYKFRTMYSSAPSELSTAEFKDAQSFITPIGRFLRRSSLDEIPQLFNVLRGDMSIVGPRPLIEKEEQVHMMREGSGAFSLRPGITGLAQIMGRDMLDDVKKVYYDTQYAFNLSFLTDLRIIFSTFFKVAKRENINLPKKEKNSFS